MDSIRTATPALDRHTKQYRTTGVLKDIWRRPFLYLMALPGLLFLVVFNYVPMYGLIIAFKDFDVSKGILKSHWVGLQNFKFFFTSDQLFSVIKNTLFINILFIAFTTIAALFIALLLNEMRLKLYKKVTQSLILLPYFMSWVVVSMLVDAFFGGQHPTINQWLASIGLEGKNWFFMPAVWPYLLTIIRVWQGAGYLSIIFMAAIAAIPDEINEAAIIDGASRFQVMVKITIPLLMPVVSILTLLAVGKIFNADFGMIYAIIGDNSILYPTTDVIDTFVFRAMRRLGDFGMSSAVGLFQSVMGFLFVLTANLIVRKYSRDSSLF